jgi:hypothetical protein
MTDTAQVEQRQVVEMQRLIEETRKFTAEQHKLIAEASKMRTERWLMPVIVVFGAIGSLTLVRLTDSPKARSYNIVSEVEALARGEKLQHGAVGRDENAAAPNSAKQA